MQTRIQLLIKSLAQPINNVNSKNHQKKIGKFREGESVLCVSGPYPPHPGLDPCSHVVYTMSAGRRRGVPGYGWKSS